jgi:ATP-dependent Clp protease ATP-binding subunit ClpA
LIKAELKSGGFTQEQLGRIDTIFPFKPLDRAAVAQIVGRYLVKRAETIGVRLVSVDAALLVDLIQNHEKDNSGGVRSLVTLAENTVTTGLLAVKDSGHSDALIRVIDGKVSVQPVASDAAA